MIKFGFRIRTKSGLQVDNLAIQARDQAEAEHKLRQMYHRCEVVECQVIDTGRRIGARRGRVYLASNEAGGTGEEMIWGTKPVRTNPLATSSSSSSW